MKSKERITQLERENELLRQIIKLHEAKESLESRPIEAAPVYIPQMGSGMIGTWPGFPNNCTFLT